MKAINKDFFREIKKTKNRFISIGLIVALGVAFFAGVRATGPDMAITADDYYDQTNLADIRILSTWGIDEEEINAIRNTEHIKEVEPIHNVCLYGNIAESKYNLNIMSLPKEINQLDVVEGRMPENDLECVIDSRLLFYDEYEIGKTINLQSPDDNDIKESLKNTSYKIVGIVNTSYYVSRERGSTDFGNGIIDGYVMVLDSEFTMDVYTEVFVTLDNTKELLCYSDEYDNIVENTVEDLEKNLEGVGENRYYKIINDAQTEIDDGQEEISDGQKKIEDGEKELEEGTKELEEGQKEADERFEEALEKLVDGENKYNQGIIKLQAAQVELDSKKDFLKTSQEEIDKYFSQYYEEKEKFQTQINDGNQKLEASKEQLDLLLYNINNLKMIYPANSENVILLEEQYNMGMVEYSEGVSELNAKETAGNLQFQEKYNELLEKQEEINQGKNEIQQFQAEIDANTLTLEASKEEILEGYEEYYREREEVNKEIEENQLILKDKRQELEEAKADLEKAKGDLEEAQEKINALDPIEYYVLDRNTITGYVEYHQDSQRIEAIGEVFPAIFFIVAALVSLTTMTRMVESDRTQIGTLKALGYKKRKIAGKYIKYGLFASVIGSLFGMVIGQRILPVVIVQAYSMMYSHMPATRTPLNLEFSLVSTIVAILTTTCATIFACYKELIATPAILMRPIAPKGGRKLFIENIKFIWNKLKFTQKITVRNLVRYKKRFFMTIFGIGGCMALLVVGFGLQDSIFSIIEKQYEVVFIYGCSITVDTDGSIGQQNDLKNYFENSEYITDHMRIKTKSIDVYSESDSKTANLFVPENTEEMSKYVGLINRTTKEEYIINDNGVIINEKLAELLNLKVGDTIEISHNDSERKSVEINAIVENHLYNYVYMSSSLYEEIYGSSPEYNEVLINFNQLNSEIEEQVSMEMLSLDYVEAVNMATTTKNKVIEMLDGMDFVIIVLIVSAGALAFIVLYNLNNINISERRRELATIKVLGFYDNEVASYVYRENVVLTLVGSILGIFMGIFLHKFVITTAELDMIMFGREIFFKSYVYSFLLTILFSLIVNALIYFRLKKIDMVESLKSVE